MLRKYLCRPLEVVFVLKINRLRQDHNFVVRIGLDDFLSKALIIRIQIPEVSASLADDDEIRIKLAFARLGNCLDSSVF